MVTEFKKQQILAFFTALMLQQKLKSNDSAKRDFSG
jgi:hypothetical protein